MRKAKKRPPKKPVHSLKSLHQEAALPYVRPWYWLSNDRDAETYLGGASFFVVHGTDGLFGVTANHAVEAFYQQTPIGVIPRFFNHSFDIASNLIGQSTRWDVATFRLTGLEANKMGIIPFAWPPLRPKKNCGAVIVGYFCKPERVSTKGGRLGFDKMGNPLTASYVGTQLIRVGVKAPKYGRPRLWSQLTDAPHGFSGSPMLTVTENKGRPLHVGGIVVRFQPVNANRGHFEVIPLDACVRSDGTLI